MEEIVVYLVQFWVEGYQYWSNVAEPSTGLFSVPQVGYEDEAAAREKLSAMREAYPTGRYRLVRQTTRSEEI